MWDVTGLKKKGIASLKSRDTGEQAGDAIGKATILNKQFQLAGFHLWKAHSYLMTTASPGHTQIYQTSLFTENGIQWLLPGLDHNKASQQSQSRSYRSPQWASSTPSPTKPDKVLPKVLKELAAPSPYTEWPLQQDLPDRNCSKDWCHANVFPVYKKGKNILAVITDLSVWYAFAARPLRTLLHQP